MLNQRRATTKVPPANAIIPTGISTGIKENPGVSVIVALVLFLGSLFLISSGEPESNAFMGSTPNLIVSQDNSDVTMATWNIAAINNNPFEYWLTFDDVVYDRTMDAVQQFIQDPGYKDVPVQDVFTQSMFENLVSYMSLNSNFDASAIEATRELWESDFKHRRIIADFMQDPVLGSKRLASMPDRVTNTMPLNDGSFAYRPTVINCYSESLNSVSDWWPKWSKFMFVEELDTVKMGRVIPANMLKIIPRAKYGALSEHEEAISIPLQTMAGGIFDAILVHIMTIVDGSVQTDDGGRGNWQGLRTQICENLNLKKNDRIVNILEKSYMDMDIFCLQEVAAGFIHKLQASFTISSQYHIVSPLTKSSSDQNSVLLLSKQRFPHGINEDVSATLVYDDPKMVAPGDVLLVRAMDKNNLNFLIGSFHGDTNGLATIPVTKAIHSVLSDSEELLFGLDANTYEHSKPGKTQDVIEYAAAIAEMGLTSVRGHIHIDPTQYTTYNARTFLQPQLNKASSKAEIREKGDVNPKDFIIFKQNHFRTIRWSKDNTGNREYIEEMVFPTLSFPSDHGVMFAHLRIA